MSETRREFLRTAGGIGLTAGLGLGAWGALELFLPDGTADTWHKSVCRYCGTGGGVRVGMRDGKITDVRGDESAHNKGIICVKGATLPQLNALPGRLTKPLIRKGGGFAEASWDEAMSLVASRFREAIARGKDRVG